MAVSFVELIRLQWTSFIYLASFQLILYTKPRKSIYGRVLLAGSWQGIGHYHEPACACDGLTTLGREGEWRDQGDGILS